MNVLTIFGTRPEAIKLAPLIRGFEMYPNDFTSKVCVTAQHRQMLDQVLSFFEIKPDHDLNIMQNNQSLSDVTVRVLKGIEDVLKKEKPDLVVVQGDTTTTMAGALAAYYGRIPVAHVEAGLRTFNKYHPFPEEVNRRMTSHIADYHFSPTEQSRKHLLREGIESRKIWVTGNTVVDALNYVVRKQSEPNVAHRWVSFFEKIGFSFKVNRKVILVTGHRRENFGQGLEDICAALKEIAINHADVDIVYPVHLNPNVQEPVNRILGNVANIYLIPPLEYEPFVFLMSKSYLILTDSGGVQEEAPSLGKPVLIMRETTERSEAVESGIAKLVGTNFECIISTLNLLLENNTIYKEMVQTANPYGDGLACERILEVLRSESR